MIPAEYKGLPVTGIAGEGFQHQTKIKSVTLPSTVTTIRSGAFYGCTNLEIVELPEGITEIGEKAFEKTKLISDPENYDDGVLYLGNYLIKANPAKLPSEYSIRPGTVLMANDAFLECVTLKSVVVPDSLCVISQDAFANCTSLESVVLHDGVTDLGWGGFAGCSSLKEFDIPRGVTFLNDSAFHQCSALESIVIPESVTRIGYSAFSGCASLKSVTLPESVTMIDESAFSYCSSLTEIELPKGLIYIGARVFDESPICDDPAFRDADGCVYSGTYLISARALTKKNYTVKPGTTVIAGTAFDDNWYIRNVTVPESVVFIGEDAFEDCAYLEEIVFKSVDGWKMYDRDFVYLSDVTWKSDPKENASYIGNNTDRIFTRYNTGSPDDGDYISFDSFGEMLSDAEMTEKFESRTCFAISDAGSVLSVTLLPAVLDRSEALERAQYLAEIAKKNGWCIDLKLYQLDEAILYADVEYNDAEHEDDGAFTPTVEVQLIGGQIHFNWYREELRPALDLAEGDLDEDGRLKEESALRIIKKYYSDSGIKAFADRFYDVNTDDFTFSYSRGTEYFYTIDAFAGDNIDVSGNGDTVFVLTSSMFIIDFTVEDGEIRIKAFEFELPYNVMTSDPVPAADAEKLWNLIAKGDAEYTIAAISGGKHSFNASSTEVLGYKLFCVRNYDSDQHLAEYRPRWLYYCRDTKNNKEFYILADAT